MTGQPSGPVLLLAAAVVALLVWCIVIDARMARIEAALRVLAVSMVRAGTGTAP